MMSGMKKMTHDLTYDAPASAVAAMLADPAFREEVVEAQHVLRHDVQVTGDPAAGSGTVIVEQVQSATRPAVVRRASSSATRSRSSRTRRGPRRPAPTCT